MLVSYRPREVNAFRQSFSHTYSHTVNNFTVIHLNSPAIIKRVFVLPELRDKVSVVVRTKGRCGNSNVEDRNSKQIRKPNIEKEPAWSRCKRKRSR